MEGKAKWRKKNKKHIREKSREYFKKNKDKIYLYAIKHYHENKEKYRAMYIVKKNRKYILKKLGAKCSLCGVKNKLHIHHTDYTIHEPIEYYDDYSLQRYKFNDKNLKYLTVLCSTCHPKAHEELRRKERKKRAGLPQKIRSYVRRI